MALCVGHDACGEVVRLQEKQTLVSSSVGVDGVVARAVWPGCVGLWLCGGPRVLLSEVETKLVGEFAGPELVDDQTVMVWL